MQPCNVYLGKTFGPQAIQNDHLCLYVDPESGEEDEESLLARISELAKWLRVNAQVWLDPYPEQLNRTAWYEVNVGIWQISQGFIGKDCFNPRDLRKITWRSSPEGMTIKLKPTRAEREESWRNERNSTAGTPL